MKKVSLRDVMRRFPQGVVVVTAMGEEGPRGITVSSFASISLEPPLVLISIMKEARAHDAIARGSFVVNVLADDQGPLSDHFARPNLSSGEQFEGVESEGEPPVLEGCLGYLHCWVVDRMSQADHTLFIGRIEKAELGAEGKPLIFFSRQYWSLDDMVHRRSGIEGK